ncbi:hypothetical protein EVAR_8860_1 [Eumeta japonica]|uniref:Uncharacterized protein n=1 Tax=Eumeta variegata TaxID=151549 RepID=A0A4C1TUE3_EUMVA|nr:hypothetical protein EVAR_8860_1 [Eumeta japonica]
MGRRFVLEQCLKKTNVPFRPGARTRCAHSITINYQPQTAAILYELDRVDEVSPGLRNPTPRASPSLAPRDPTRRLAVPNTLLALRILLVLEFKLHELIRTDSRPFRDRLASRLRDRYERFLRADTGRSDCGAARTVPVHTRRYTYSRSSVDLIGPASYLSLPALVAMPVPVARRTRGRTSEGSRARRGRETGAPHLHEHDELTSAARIKTESNLHMQIAGSYPCKYPLYYERPNDTYTACGMRRVSAIVTDDGLNAFLRRR